MPLKENDARTLASWKPNLLRISSDATNIANSLFSDEILQTPHVEEINAKNVNDDKMVLLIAKYEQRANDLEPLKRALQKFEHQTVINEHNLVPHCDGHIIKDIKARLQFMCENVAKAWGRLLSETSLEKCFVKPEIIEEEMREDGKKRRIETGKSINSYEQLFESETFGARIVIEGEPGIGKTTYVDKLALDWTWDEGTSYCSDEGRFLQSNFHVVFLIPLRTLNGGKCVTLIQASEVQVRGCGSWLSDKFQNNPANCLLILDAFDEYDGLCPEINEIINGSRFPQLKVIITTRPSHIQRLEKGPQWFSITGLTTKKKRERFLVKQGWDKLLDGDMINLVLSELGSLWHTPLYLAMLCVLYKAKKVTHFEPARPDCFYVLVRLFTEHIMSRCVKEKGMSLNEKERLNLKSHIQQRAFQQFVENFWLSEAAEDNHLLIHFIKKGLAEMSLCISDELKKQAANIGLIIIHEVESPLTGENIEIISFIHQTFVEYYAAVQFGPIFNDCSNKEEVVQSIDKNLSLIYSPFSYFLAAECESYKQLLVKRQIDCSKNNMQFLYEIKISEFPWLPEIGIADEDFIALPKDIPVLLTCSLNTIKDFWNIHYVNKICSIAQPTMVIILDGFLGSNLDSLDHILSSVNQLELYQCYYENINLSIEKVFPNLTAFYIYGCGKETGKLIELVKHFPKLHKLYLDTVPITNHNILSFCDSLQNMNQLRMLKLWECFKSSQSVSHVIQLTKTIECSLWKTLKKLDLFCNILDTETESSTEILFNAISKCAQFEKLILYGCKMKPHSLIIIRDIFQISDNLKNNLKCLTVVCEKWYEEDLAPEKKIQTEITEGDLIRWKSEVEKILPLCARAKYISITKNIYTGWLF